MQRTIFLFYFLLPLISVGQQTQYRIQGVIRESDSKQPVAFANISIQTTSRGTAANDQGEFSLMILPGDFSKSLRITSIGYVSKEISLSKISIDKLLIIELDRDVKLLDNIEVVTSRVKPEDLVAMAIDSIGVNYRSEPFNLEFYSRMQASNPVVSQTFTIESIVLGYYKGYASASHKKFEIKRKRAQGENPMKAADYPFWPTLEIHRADLIADPVKTGIFNKKNLDKFEFEYKGIVMFDNDTLLQVDYFAPKPTTKITGYGVVPKNYSGSVFVTLNTAAVVRHDITTDSFSYSIRYKKHDQWYFPYLITGKRTFKDENMFTTILNSILLTDIILDSVKVIDYQTNEFTNLDQLPDDKEYWNLHYPLGKE